MEINWWVEKRKKEKIVKNVCSIWRCSFLTRHKLTVKIIGKYEKAYKILQRLGKYLEINKT